MKIEAPTTRTVDAKILKLHLKVRDEFYATLQGADGEVLGEYEGYVKLMPGDHYGDYVYLDIDLETGQITNWKQPTPEEVVEFLEECEE